MNEAAARARPCPGRVLECSEACAPDHRRVGRGDAPDRGGAEDFAKAARKRFGGRLTKYVRECVLPLLSGARLITAGGRFREPTGWTASGRQAVDELDEWMAVGRRNLRPWVSRDPARGIAWASSGGAAVLLMNDFYPQFVRLGRFLADRRVPADSGGAAIGIPLSLDDPLGAEPGSELFGVEVSDLDLGFLAADFGGFDGLDGARPSTQASTPAVSEVVGAEATVAALVADRPTGSYGQRLGGDRPPVEGDRRFSHWSGSGAVAGPGPRLAVNGASAAPSRRRILSAI